jgi:hypothetical protein
MYTHKRAQPCGSSEFLIMLEKITSTARLFEITEILFLRKRRKLSNRWNLIDQIDRKLTVKFPPKLLMNQEENILSSDEITCHTDGSFSENWFCVGVVLDTLEWNQFSHFTYNTVFRLFLPEVCAILVLFDTCQKARLQNETIYIGENGALWNTGKMKREFYFLMKRTLNLFLLKKKHECFTLPLTILRFI